MKWANELVIEFLDRYEAEPIIWNTGFADHKNKDKETSHPNVCGLPTNEPIRAVGTTRHVKLTSQGKGKPVPDRLGEPRAVGTTRRVKLTSQGKPVPDRIGEPRAVGTRLYIRKEFDTCLPSTTTLPSWYKSVDAEPGFCTEALNAIKLYWEANDALKNKNLDAASNFLSPESLVMKHVEVSKKLYSVFHAMDDFKSLGMKTPDEFLTHLTERLKGLPLMDLAMKSKSQSASPPFSSSSSQGKNP
ncbi:hypothetical protein M8J77_007420 [Diaphorina citri]|nr:hypothetical protein M8J77_007420 [Diaphorina citri]